MAAKRKDPKSRYDVKGNVEARYVDEAKTILVNKRGITDLAALEVAEEEALAEAYGTLYSQIRVDTPMTSELLRHIHATIFGTLYEWAGHWRTVGISKPGVIWPPPDFLDEAMKDFEGVVLAAYPVERLREDRAFCQAIGHIQGEFLAIHPFREGNARTIKLMSDLLPVQTGRHFPRYDASSAGVAAYLKAARAALAKDYGPMVDAIAGALERSRRGT